MNNLIVKIRNLTVDFKTIDGILKVIEGVDISVRRGEIVGIVGETGCGKSVTAKVLLGILPMPPARINKGEVYFLDRDLLRANRADREMLKQKIAYIPQDPMTSLNPVFPVGTLMTDLIIWRMSNQSLGTYLWKRRKKSVKKEAENYAVELLDKVHIPDPKSFMSKYAIQLSGGMRQRVLLSLALVGKPELLIADEPTTALDVTIQKRTLHLFQEKVSEENLSGIYITHNLGVARIICDRTYVMYAGTVVESGNTIGLLDRPFHPYTQGLIKSIPRLTGEHFSGIDGQIPDYLEPPSGCRFHPRCPERTEACAQEPPRLVQMEDNRFVACRLYY